MRSRAERKFDRCQVKVIKFNSYSFTKDVEIKPYSRFIVPVRGFDNVEKVPTESTPLNERGANIDAGMSARLHCPLTEDERRRISTHRNLRNRTVAYDELRQDAAKILCATCRFATMTPVEVAQVRAQEARADAELLEAKAVRAKAIAELIEVDSTYKSLEN